MHASQCSRAGTLPTLTVVAASLLAPVPTPAAPDTSGWKCERCPFPAGHEAEVSIGSSYVSDDTAYIGDTTGYDEKGAYANVDGNGLLAAGSHRLSWRAEDLGLDSRAVELDGSQAGRFDYRLAYRELPRHRYDTTSTIFSRESGNLLALPAGWTFAGTTSGFTDLAASLFPKDIEGERQALELGGRYQATSRLRLFADYQRQEQDGTGMLGGAYFTNSSLLPHHFDWQTDQVDAGIRYDGDRGWLKLAYYGSFFKDRQAAARWESPFVTAPGAEQVELAEAPDNDFQQLALTGGYRLAFMDTRVTFTAAVGRGTQDDALLPYTTNANLATGPLPVSSLDAEVDTTNLALAIVSRPAKKARLKFAIRYDERDNDTDSLPWERVIADTFLSGETDYNVPYEFDRLRMNVSGEYRILAGLDVAAGYDYTEINRQYQEVDQQTEDSGWGRLRWRPVGWFDMTARGGISRRDVDSYDLAVAASLDQNPLLRKYNLAYRYRQFGEVSATATPPEWPVTIGARVSYADDSYSSTTLGLTDSNELRIAMDLGWPLSERASVYLTGGYDDIESEQAGSAGFATADWQADQSDKFYSLGGGFRVTAAADRLELRLDYTRARGRTDIDVTGGGGPSDFPDLESTLETLRVRLDYRWSDRLQTQLQLRYEDFPTEDWALEGVAPDTLPTVLTLGARPYDEEVWIVGLSFRYLLGE